MSMTRKRKGLYTDEDIATLIALRGEGKTEKEIAMVLGRSFNSVHCKIKELIKDGRLQLIRDTTPISDDDITELASKHLTTPRLVELVVEVVGTRMRNRIGEVDAALLAFNVQDRCCAYFGVGISLEVGSADPTRAVLTKDRVGRPMWISKVAARMRGKLSHETFLKSIATIYEHVFTRT